MLADPATVARAIHDLPKPSLCLDFDGTLVEIAPRPEAITVDPALPTLLRSVAASLDGRLALISGRTHADLSTFLDVTDYAVATSHGAQFSAPGEGRSRQLLDSKPLDPLRPSLAQAIAPHPDVYLEDKGTAIAVHTRPNPSVHAELLETVGKLASDQADIKVSDGKGIVEIKLTGETKGTAIRRLMQMPGWLGSQPVMIGDDTTDDDGMVDAQQFGGFGVQVGDGPNGAPLSHAALCLPTVADLHAMLRLLG
ncbi:MAG: trehalose-phosphatase [Pseudomonadota bacterium]